MSTQSDAPKKRVRSKKRSKRTPTKRTLARKSKSLVHDNGKGRGRRTPAQLARQERVYNLYVIDQKTIRQIAADEGVDAKTVSADLKYESQRRAAENEAQREFDIARSIDVYRSVQKRAVKKSELYDGIAADGGKVVDHSLDAIIKAQERIDKIKGIDAPTRVDLGLTSLLEALAPPKE